MLGISLWTTLLLLFAAIATAQNVIDDLSFGHRGRLSQNSANGLIPGWSVLGEGHVPQIMSDKVILTPPVGGPKRGAIWSEKKNSLAAWTATLDFRAGGADRGSGNFQLWYVKNGKDTISKSSIYTAGKWDGMAIVVDTVGGVQKIRGFLNDGNTDYKSHPMVESLPFGNCDYNYRNRGSISQLVVRSGGVAGLEVLIDGRMCFSTPKIVLPAEYTFGLTAASSDPPDSFEAFKLQIASPVSQVLQDNSQQQQQQQQQPPIRGGAASESADHPASYYTTSAAQFEDLHSRLHLLSKSISTLFGEIQRHTQQEENRYQEILRQLQVGSPSSGGSGSGSGSGGAASLGNLESRVANLDRMISDIHREVKSSDHKGNYEKLSAQIQQNHEGLTEHIPGRLREYVQNHTPRIGFIAFSFMTFQSVCLAFLLWQKYRKSTMPKKFL